MRNYWASMITRAKKIKIVNHFKICWGVLILNVIVDDLGKIFFVVINVSFISMFLWLNIVGFYYKSLVYVVQSTLSYPI